MPFLASPLRFLLHYAATRKVAFLLLGLVTICGSSSAVGVQYAMKLLVDAMTARTAGITPVHFALLLFVGFVALEGVLLRTAATMLCRITVATGIRIRLDMFDYLVGHPMPFFQDQRAGSLGHRVGALTGSFGTLTHRLVLEVAPPLISFGGALIIFLSIDVGAALILALVFVTASLVLVMLGLRGQAHDKAFARRAGQSGGELVDLISNIWAIKAFSARRRELDRLEGYFAAEAEAQRAGWLFVERLRWLHDGALILLVGGTLAWAIGRWQVGAITTGDVVIVSAMTFRMLNGARDLAMALIDTSRQFSYLGETLEVIAVPQTLADAANAAPLRIGAGAVRLESVTFGHDPHRPVLHDLTIDVPAGQKVGIVGASGAGKSTILQLVQRLHDPQAGRVLIDGQPADAVTQESLRAAIAVVPQEVLLFHRSIMENIRFARPDASDEAVFEAARAARCDGFIAELPDGYDTVVGERGTNLSGGQRQRIGIARAFLKDAPIVLLDEATSALDTSSELAVQQGLAALMANRTVLAVAHRLSTLAAFDRILVIDDGRVVEDGPPQRLLAQGGPFRRLWALQAQGMERPAGAARHPVVHPGRVAAPLVQRSPRAGGRSWRRAIRSL